MKRLPMKYTKERSSNCEELVDMAKRPAARPLPFLGKNNG